MSQIPTNDGIRGVRSASSGAMLVSCTRCGTLHPPAYPLAFHPFCATCTRRRLRR